MPLEDNILERQLAYYIRRVPWHDQLMSYRGRDEMERFSRPMIDLFAPLIAGRSVLEVAAGTGNWTEVIASRAKQVCATDAVAEALTLAAEKLKDRTNIEWRQLDALALTEIDRTFEVVFAADWYSHIPVTHIEKFWNDTASVLSPGGVVILTDMTCKRSLKEQIDGYDNDGNCLSRRNLPDGTEHVVIKNFPDEDVVCKAAALRFDCVTISTLPELKRWLYIGERRS